MLKLKAVLIDDEKSSLQSLSFEINAYCPDVEVVATFKDPKEGLAHIMTLPPDILFLDIEMPGMNGFDVLRWIRCQHALDAMSVVMLSSSEETRDLNEARHFGAQCYIAKFPNATQLQEIVAEAERLAAASPDHTFKLPWNLLVASPRGTRQAAPLPC